MDPKMAYYNKEELYDVIAALSAVIRELTKEIVELQGIICYNTELMEG
jgi:hypothetical protein